MNDQKNLLLAIVLSAAVLLGWTLLSNRYFPTATPRSTVVQDGKQVVLPKPAADPAADGPAATKARELVFAESQRVAIRTPALLGTINLTGARIDDLVLVKYRETIQKNSPAIRLFSPSGAPGAYFAQLGWTGAGAPPADAKWTASAAELTVASPVTLTWTNPAGVRFEIKLSVDDSYLFTVEQRVVNMGATPLSLRPYSLVARDGKSKDPDAWTAHVGPMGVFDDIVHDVNWDTVTESGSVPFTSRGGWVGFTDKYWLTALIPDQRARVDATIRHGANDRFQANFALNETVQPRSAATVTSHLFAGAKEVQVLDGYRNKLGIPQFDKALDWGWFYWIAKPMFYLLDWLFRMVGNFGVAIICLTLIVRTLMFPIANKQYASMARMRVVQPKMKALQEKWKDDKLRLQQETMELYKTEKVNPLAGCLPIFLQIPVFYGLYKALTLTIEMRHQPFVLWIKDLSAPDPLTPVNLFGLLPFTPPHVIALGVLPIILGISMWLQQKFNPQPMDPAQKQVFALMPWVFMFIMAPFASGLVVYWIVSNFFTVGQQWWLTRQHSVPAEAKA